MLQHASPHEPVSAPATPAPIAANEKLASGFSNTLSEANVWETETFTPELWWGHDYMHQRYYSNQLGRFVSVDPIGGSVGSSQSWNRYSYVKNNPINLIDPDGRAARGVLEFSNITRNMSDEETEDFIEVQTEVERTVAVATAPVMIGLGLPGLGLSTEALTAVYLTGAVGGTSSAVQTIANDGTASDVIENWSAGTMAGYVQGLVAPNKTLAQGASAFSGHLIGQLRSGGHLDKDTLMGAAISAGSVMTGSFLAKLGSATPIVESAIVNGYQALVELPWRLEKTQRQECPTCNPDN